jgi:tetrachlorobenzoquinone reductase
MEETLVVRVRTIALEAEGVQSFELASANPDQALPAYLAGAHIDVHMRTGVVRSYSLCNTWRDGASYVIAVGHDPKSRGGSRFMLESLRVGETLTIGYPRNNFPLAEASFHHVFVAGGIGITPIWNLIQEASARGNSWELLYCARSRKHAAFLAHLEKAAANSGGKIQLHFDSEAGGVADIDSYLSRVPSLSHAYCCGPSAMLDVFLAATAKHLPCGHAHIEYFKAAETPSREGASFKVRLARSGRSFDVPEGKTLLDVLLDAEVDVSFSCMDGICGSCEVKVLEGTPDHRDGVLSEARKRANDAVIVCCSRSKTDELVLDL